MYLRTADASEIGNCWIYRQLMIPMEELAMAYSEEKARALVTEAGRRLLESGLIARTWGNISARISDTEFIITPSGRAYDTLRPDELVKCKIADCSYEGSIKPSSEKGIHAEGYRLRKDCNFIIHTHQFYATVVGTEEQSVVDDEGIIVCAAYGMPSTAKLKKNVAKAIAEAPGCNSVLMARHGALCLGKDCDDAFALAGRLEERCKAIYEKRCPECRGHELEIISAGKKTLFSPIDDLAQIAGVTIRCIDGDAGEAAVKRALKGRNAVMLAGKEPVCTGEDADAVRQLLEKGCAAACYTGTLKGLGRIDALIQRFVYLKKYSKRK